MNKKDNILHKSSDSIADAAALERDHGTIELNECFYSDKLKAIMQDELLYKMSMQEGSCDREDWEPNFQVSKYLLATKDGNDIGFIQLNPLTHVCCVIHSYLLPKYWGPRDIAHECHQLLVSWMLDNTGYLSIVAYVPEKMCTGVIDRLLLEGYTMKGRLPESIYFRGCLDNMIVFHRSLCRPKPSSLM